jgi:hypothetical protein
MFLRGGKNRFGAAVALAAVLAMALAAPAGAAPRGGWEEARELASGFLPRFLVWLGLSPTPNAVLKCDDGATIDPNGRCQKTAGVLPVSKCDDGSQIDPNGACHRAAGVPTSRTGGGRADDGSRVDLAHRR